MKRILIVLALVFVVSAVFAQEPPTGPQGEVQVVAAAETAATSTPVWRYFAAALAVGISCVAGGIAVGQIGSAAMGAMSENPELSGKALPYAGLAEGICLWGFLVALLILVIN